MSVRPPARKAIPERIASCIVCGARNECVRASHLWGVRKDSKRLRQVVDEIRYNKPLTPTAEIEEGRRSHKLLEERRSVIKDLGEIVRRINERSPPFYMTATFCSPTFGGLRCQPDAVLVDSRGDTLRILIIEDKTSNQPRYYPQLYAEAVIFTDRHCLVAPAFEGEQLGLGGRADQTRVPFYPQLKGFNNFILDAALNPYGTSETLRDSPLPPIHFSVNFHMLPGVEKKYYIVTKSKKAILDALRHPQGLAEDSSQARFTRQGKQLKVFVPKGR